MPACSRALLLLVNGLMGIAGTVLLVAGVWSFSYLPMSTRAYSVAPGAIIFLLSLIGCCAASNKGRCGHRMAQIIYLLVLLVCLAGMVIFVSFVFNYDNTLAQAQKVGIKQQDLDEGMKDALEFTHSQMSSIYNSADCSGGQTSAVAPAKPAADSWTVVKCKDASVEKGFQGLVTAAGSDIDAEEFWGCVKEFAPDSVMNDAKTQLFCHTEDGLVSLVIKYAQALEWVAVGVAVLTLLLTLATLRMLCSPRQPTPEEELFIQQQQQQQQQMVMQQGREVRQNAANIVY